MQTEETQVMPLNENKGKTSLDLQVMWNKVWTAKWRIIIAVSITFILSAIYIVSIPRYYRVEVKLAPELGGSQSSGGLGNIMKSFGLGSMSTGGKDMDAINPTLYPDLMNSKTFLVSLFDIPVKNKKGDVNTTYFDYLAKHQKSSWISKTISLPLGLLLSLLPEDKSEQPKTDSLSVSAFSLTKKQDKITKKIKKKVICDVDKKTGVITINVTDQDPVICANIADSVCMRLQEFITEYRTKKSYQELQNAEKQLEKAKEEYETTRDEVARYNSSNWDLVEEGYLLQQRSLENELQIKYGAYSAFSQQVIQSRAKYEESRPVFTVLDGASIPVTPAGPSRGKFVLTMCFLVGACLIAWILREEIKVLLFDDDDDTKNSNTNAPR